MTSVDINLRVDWSKLLYFYVNCLCCTALYTCVFLVDIRYVLSSKMNAVFKNALTWADGQIHIGNQFTSHSVTDFSLKAVAGSRSLSDWCSTIQFGSTPLSWSLRNNNLCSGLLWRGIWFWYWMPADQRWLLVIQRRPSTPPSGRIFTVGSCAH